MSSHKRRQKRHIASLADPRTREAVFHAEDLYPSEINLSDEFGCNTCWHVLYKTWSCCNGHRICSSCLAHLRRVTFQTRCPLCRAPRFVRRREVDRCLLNQHVGCRFKRERHGCAPQPCQWTGHFKQLREHIHVIPPRPVVAPADAALGGVCDDYVLLRPATQHTDRPADVRVSDSTMDVT